MIRQNFLAAFALTASLVSLFSGGALAADPAPGDACSTANAYILSGGPENAGLVYLMTCQGGIWSQILTGTTSGYVGIGTTTPVSALGIAGSFTGTARDMIHLTNTDSSTGQSAGIAITSNDVTAGITVAGSGYTLTSGEANGILLQNANANGHVDLQASGANGYLRFITNGDTNERMRIDNNGYVGIGTATPVSKFVVAPPASQALTAGGQTITADACGTIKQLTTTGNNNYTTNTTNTFTAPTASYAGCCMDVVNLDSTPNTITLDDNAKFLTAGGGNIVLNRYDMVRVCSDGTNWYQAEDKVAGGAGGGAIDDLSDAATDYSEQGMIMGQGAGASMTTGSYSTALGYNALENLSIGFDNNSFGASSGTNIEQGSGNVVMGADTFGGAPSTCGASGCDGNTAIGEDAMASAGSDADYNTAIGAQTLQYVTSISSSTGKYNTAVGYLALQDNTEGGYNTAVGTSALKDNTTGWDNISIGDASSTSITTGGENTVVGTDSGQGITSGDQNTILGGNAGNGITTGSGNVMIGMNANTWDGTADNLLVIGDGALYGSTVYQDWLQTDGYFVAGGSDWDNATGGNLLVESSNAVGASMTFNATDTGGKRYSLIATADGATIGGGGFGIWDNTDTVYRLSLLGNGYLGIGDDLVPDFPLQVINDGENYYGGTTQFIAAFDDASFCKGIFLGYDSSNGDGIIAADRCDAPQDDTNNLQFFTPNGGTMAEKMRLTNSGHVEYKGTAPSVGTCGTAPAIVGNDNAMRVTTGTTNTTACTVTFGTAWTNAPICNVTPGTSALTPWISAASTTAITITYASTNTQKLYIQCSGYR